MKLLQKDRRHQTLAARNAALQERQQLQKEQQQMQQRQKQQTQQCSDKGCCSIASPQITG